MGRPAKWSAPTVAIRVPAHLADHLLEMARTLDGSDFVQKTPGTLEGDSLEDSLRELVSRFIFLLSEDPDLIEAVVHPYRMKQGLGLSLLKSKYRSIQLCLTGHETNSLCSGIFSVSGEHSTLVLYLVLLELVTGFTRTYGGSAIGREFPLPNSHSELGGAPLGA